MLIEGTLLGQVSEKFAELGSEAEVQDDADQENFDKDMRTMEIKLTETQTDTKIAAHRPARRESGGVGGAIALNALDEVVRAFGHPPCLEAGRLVQVQGPNYKPFHAPEKTHT